jgi:hypothetical protein
LLALGCTDSGSAVPPPDPGELKRGGKTDDVGALAAPEDSRDPTRFSYWADKARAAGIDINIARTVVFGVRGQAVDGSMHEVRSVTRYDDTLVVVTSDGWVRTFLGSTHPFVAASRQPPDADGDGLPDVGMIRPGRYHATARPSARDIAQLPTFSVLTAMRAQEIPGWRDTNHDGVFDDAERAASMARGDFLTAILFHSGGPGAPEAIGCQVQPPSGFRRFVAVVGGATAEFEYVLLDGPAGP